MRHLSGARCAPSADAQALPLRDGFANLVVGQLHVPVADQIAGSGRPHVLGRRVGFLGGGYGRLLDDAIRQDLVAQAREKRAEKPDSWVKTDPGMVAKLKAVGIANVRLIEGPTEFDWWLEIRK